MKSNRINLINVCHINTNQGEDTFVGIRMQEGEIRVCFPLGYRLEKDDKGIRRDVLHLLKVLKRFSNVIREKDGAQNNYELIEGFPYIAYQKVILNYLDFGYYAEKEVTYRVGKRGKINWNKTIKTQSPVVIDNRIGYFNFSIKNINSSKENIITFIHEFCIYESIYRLGWLYNISLPQKPRLKFEKGLFLNALLEKLRVTFDDNTKELIKNMIEIISCLNSDGDANRNFGYGTNRFEYVWERLIDYVYGTSDKADYFPKTSWSLNNGNEKINSPLEPDTIMLLNHNVYILDAKYYKYGATGLIAHLPETASISKQITYGEYVEKNKECIKEIYNAFIMPYDKESLFFSENLNVKVIGEATADWKSNFKRYERVVGVLIDVKDIMFKYNRENKDVIENLASCIEKQINNQ